MTLVFNINGTFPIWMDLLQTPNFLTTNFTKIVKEIKMIVGQYRKRGN